MATNLHLMIGDTGIHRHTHDAGTTEERVEWRITHKGLTCQSHGTSLYEAQSALRKQLSDIGCQATAAIAGAVKAVAVIDKD